MKVDHVLVGFGFGPIQSGLFAKEARESGNFSDIAVAEVDASLVEVVRRNGDKYAVNVAHSGGIDVVNVEGVKLLNPRDTGDRARLMELLRRATEIVTSLPSVAIYSAGGNNSVASLIAMGLQSAKAKGTIVYTAENNNHAAEILEQNVKAVSVSAGCARPIQYLNTVIGKMSQVITDKKQSSLDLVSIVPGYPRAFLVEEFNHILVSKVILPGFEPGITVFEQKDDLLPFEEVKLFGHNAIHTLLGFIAKKLGHTLMSELNKKPEIMDLARNAFINEAGRALIARYSLHGDPLFTTEGFRQYADDLLMRMTNPYLADTVERAARDPIRKLGYSDRIFGAIRLCIEHDIVPADLAVGALAGIHLLLADRNNCGLPADLDCKSGTKLTPRDVETVLTCLWKDAHFEKDIIQVRDLLVETQSRAGALLRLTT
ncbi:MAG: hypothetical protein PHR77_17480 [Kiritimatiellae bacterium]|nr:hypothetical protein [Kiritimatiellia bacterium]